MDNDNVKRSISEYWKGSQAYTTIRKRERQGKRNFVSRTEANKRASVCIACPFNRSTHGIAAITDKLMLDRRGGRKTDHDANLRNCDACSCPLKLLVHLHPELLAAIKSKEELFTRIKRREKETKSLIHPDCWQIKLFN